MLRQMLPTLGFLTLTFALAAPAPAYTPTQGHETPVEKKAVVPGASAEPAHAEPAHADQPDILEPKPSLAIWTVVVFGGLMLVLGRFAWKPLMKALHEREAHLEQVLVDSERARNEAEALAAQLRKELSHAAEEVRALIEEARKEATTAANSIIQKAQAEAESSRQRAEREIAGAKDQALMEIWTQTADLAVSVAGKVLSKEMGESDHRRLVEMALGELPKNGHGGTPS